MPEKWEDHFDAIRTPDAHLPAYSAAVLRDAVKENPKTGIFWLLLGDDLTSLLRFDEAEDALKRGLELTPADKRRNAYSLLGHLADAVGDSSRAEEWYKMAIDNAPRNASGYIYLGALYASLCRMDDAENMHRQGAMCSDGCVDEAYFNLGLVLRAQGRLGEAKECFERAIALEDVEMAMAYASKEVQPLDR
jgi:tetratricopeptide (TPR) repeat protein